MKCVAALLFSAHVVSAVVLRRAPVQERTITTNISVPALATNNSSANSSSANNSEADQALEAVAAMLNAHKKPERHAAPANASVHRAKVDLGFAGFEKNLTQQVEEGVRNATQDPQWTTELREKLIANITGSVTASLKEQLTSVKKSIGETWMGLPDPDQQDEYVAQLHSAFAPIFATSSNKVLSHFSFGVKRVQALGKMHKKLSPEELVLQSEKTLLDSIVNKRCYNADDAFVQLEASHDSAPPTAKKVQLQASHDSAPPAAKKKTSGKFCIPPQISTVAGNLNDTQGLISMGFKFEAHALSFVQIL